MRGNKWLRRTIALGALGVVTAALGVAQTVPGRISSQVVDLGDVLRIYLAPGLASVVQLPYPITEVKLGNPDDIYVQVSKTLPSELTVILKRNGARPTNLVARCGTKTFVIDLIPSRSTHQDLVRISGSYGGPESTGLGAVMIDSSHSGGKAAKRPKEDDGILIDSSQKSTNRRSKPGGRP